MNETSNDRTTDSGKTGAALLVEVYRSPRHELMYAYLPARHTESAQDQDEGAGVEADSASGTHVSSDPSADLSVLPEVLLQRFGQPVYSFSFALSAGQTLATAHADTVLAAIAEQGFYLQLPPTLRPETTPDAINPHESNQ